LLLVALLATLFILKVQSSYHALNIVLYARVLGVVLREAE
jgi:hypothetical protein